MEEELPVVWQPLLLPTCISTVWGGDSRGHDVNNYQGEPGSLPGGHYTMQNMQWSAALWMASLQPRGGREVMCHDTAILQDAGGKEETELFYSALLVFSCVVLFLQYSLSHT